VFVKNLFQFLIKGYINIKFKSSNRFINLSIPH